MLTRLLAFYGADPAFAWALILSLGFLVAGAVVVLMECRWALQEQRRCARETVDHIMPAPQPDPSPWPRPAGPKGWQNRNGRIAS